MKYLLYYFICVAALSCNRTEVMPTSINISKQQLEDKIKGGWAGQAIGCTYGGPTEFQFKGALIHDYIKFEWTDSSITHYYNTFPGLYDDVYMDATFVTIFDKYGLDAPLDSFANAFAHAQYPLWHANQAARFNILNGIKAPASGHWMNNPHADDIDFQIEADFAGLMTPGMPQHTAVICDAIGHIMNYGDGWYGGVYMATMYSLAFVSNDIKWIVKEGLKSIPKESKYYQCMEDVIRCHAKYPNDWKQTWFEIGIKWDEDLFCPDGVFTSFNIDANINSAYVLIALLYGEGDFTKTMDIAMRCGQDSDCNPATAAGILGTMLGYSHIPEAYLRALRHVEDRHFIYTEVSLNDVYKMSYSQALEVIKKNGGTFSDTDLEIKCQSVIPVQLERSFEGYYPTRKAEIHKKITGLSRFEFDGKGIIFGGKVMGPAGYIAELELYIDDKLAEKVNLPIDYNARRDDLLFKFGLSNTKHVATFKWLNPIDGADVHVNLALVFGDK